MRSTPTTRICVYCGSNAGTSPSFAEAAQQLGSALAHRGIGLVYGGGHVGLMGVVADAALAADGEVIGVITEQLVRAEVAHETLSCLEVLPTMHDRKARLTELADGFIVLPGGFGTIDENSPDAVVPAALSATVTTDVAQSGSAQRPTFKAVMLKSL